MKKFLYIAAIIGLISCEQSENSIQRADLEVNVTAGQDESITITDASDAVTLFNVTIVEIHDSRCPLDPNVQCITGGYASAGFEAEGLSFSLKIGESKEFTSGGSAYKLTLIEVLPVPMLANMGDKKTIVFVVHSL